MGVSYETYTPPRWARSTGGVDETDVAQVVEPNSQQRNEGWLSTDTPVREWWNWMWREAHKGLEYLRGWFEDAMPVTTLARSGKALASMFDETQASQQIAVAAGTAFIDGRRYEFPTTVVSLTTQVSQAVMHRILVAKLVGNTPTITKVDGPSTGVDPTLAAGEIPLWRAKQNTGSPTFAAVEDLRRWGAIEVDDLSAERVDGVFALVAAYDVDGTARTARYLREQVHCAGMKVDQGTPSPSTTGLQLATSSDQASYPLNFPAGSILTDLHAYYTTDDGTNDATVTLVCRNRITGASIASWSITIANFVAQNWHSEVAVNRTVDEDDLYLLLIIAGTNHDVLFHSLCVEYTNALPFASHPPL